MTKRDEKRSIIQINVKSFPKSMSMYRKRRNRQNDCCGRRYPLSQSLHKSAKLTHLCSEADELAVDGDGVVGEVRVHVARVHAGADQPAERGREERRPRDGLPSLPRRVKERQRGRVGGKRPSCFKRAIASLLEYWSDMK